MSRQARQQSNTGVYHVIQRGVNRMLIFHEDADRRMFLDLLKSQAGEFFKVYCFCLMDNHIHLIVKTSRLSFYIHRILTAYAIWFNHKYEREGYLFKIVLKVRSLKIRVTCCVVFGMCCKIP